MHQLHSSNPSWIADHCLRAFKVPGGAASLDCIRVGPPTPALTNQCLRYYHASAGLFDHVWLAGPFAYELPSRRKIAGPS